MKNQTVTKAGTPGIAASTSIGERVQGLGEVLQPPRAPSTLITRIAVYL